MRICIVYLSRFGHNRRIAGTLTHYLRGTGHEVLTYCLTEIRKISIPDARLYIFCSPTRFGRAPEQLAVYLRWVTIDEENAWYAIVNTYLRPQTRVIKRFSTILNRKGLNQAHSGLSLKMSSVKGPIEKGTKEKLHAFADACMKVVS